MTSALSVLALRGGFRVGEYQSVMFGRRWFLGVMLVVVALGAGAVAADVGGAPSAAGVSGQEQHGARGVGAAPKLAAQLIVGEHGDGVVGDFCQGRVSAVFKVPAGAAV